MKSENISFEVSCRCGAALKSSRWLPCEVNKAVREFNESHKPCREPSVWQQVFGDDERQQEHP